MKLNQVCELLKTSELEVNQYFQKGLIEKQEDFDYENVLKIEIIKLCSDLGYSLESIKPVVSSDSKLASEQLEIMMSYAIDELTRKVDMLERVGVLRKKIFLEYKNEKLKSLKEIVENEK